MIVEWLVIERVVKYPLQAYEFSHYENKSIQIYWKFYNQKLKIFR